MSVTMSEHVNYAPSDGRTSGVMYALVRDIKTCCFNSLQNTLVSTGDRTYQYLHHVGVTSASHGAASSARSRGVLRQPIRRVRRGTAHRERPNTHQLCQMLPRPGALHAGGERLQKADCGGSRDDVREVLAETEGVDQEGGQCDRDASPGAVGRAHEEVRPQRQVQEHIRTVPQGLVQRWVRWLR